ncbi:GMC family oxidoreductase N-terminal domain-containing protein [Caballeronia sp. AZ10_KS36]|uniref:GMC family oxidoreductase n=1 Tax=Caballeronia sp. AZ10_KS36 TaxID=2921757 RepID=UPI0020297BAC|nr:GMC family oxidoreductase N-terminal domain-containing protein [Caballeronia sp. AZ10_KS36]
MQDKQDAYDYVIVGAGSAGCVLTNRLSADPSCRVLLLEAGGKDSNFWLKLPVGYFRSIYDTRFSWQFKLEPEATTGMRDIVWPRGRVLGGSSAINGLLYIRGQRADYDDWEAFGAHGWSFKDVLPFFKRSEKYAGGETPYHGASGELGVSDLRNDHPYCEAWLRAGEEAGFSRTSDFNGEKDDGLGPYQLTIAGHWRCSAATAFLHPVTNRANLTVTTCVHVTRVLFKGDDAIGVEYVRDGVVHQARAERETLLAAGALQSPQLLQLSGIGDAVLMRQHGIVSRVHAPEVGCNLRDHYQARVIVKLKKRMSLNDDVRNPLKLAGMGAQWLFSRRGPLTVGAGQVGGLVATEHADGGRPDILFNVMPLSVDKPGDPLHGFSGFSASATQCRPESAGTVGLRSNDPFAPPLIHANYLRETKDVKTLVAGLKLLREIYDQPSFRPLVTGEEHLPGASLRSDAELEAFARQKGGTVFHPVGTCRMGTDETSVVDPELRVRGVNRLRVIDASVMPNMISTNTNAAAIMIGEKGAALVQGLIAAPSLAEAL